MELYAPLHICVYAVYTSTTSLCLSVSLPACLQNALSPSVHSTILPLLPFSKPASYEALLTRSASEWFTLLEALYNA